MLFRSDSEEPDLGEFLWAPPAHFLSRMLARAWLGQAFPTRAWPLGEGSPSGMGTGTVLPGRPDPDRGLGSTSRLSATSPPQVSGKAPAPRLQSSRTPGGCLCTKRNPGIPPRKLCRLSERWQGAATRTVGYIREQGGEPAVVQGGIVGGAGRDGNHTPGSKAG